LPEPRGGTEILFEKLTSLVDTSGVNLIKSVCDYELLDPQRPNILWEHLSYDQNNVALLHDEVFVNSLDAIVFVSHWQHDQFRRNFKLPGDRCFVIQNAIDPIEPHQKPKDKLQLIYTSTPWRGLSVLLNAVKKLKRDDFDLTVYSGTSIYGDQFAEQSQGQYDHLYKLAESVGAKHIEYAPNEEVRKALTSSHIFSYPSIWEETSCLSAIEALSAGCLGVTTNFGALPETCGTWADYTAVSDDLVEWYADALDKALDNYWSDETQDKLNDQVEYYNKYWTWDTRKTQWEEFLSEFKGE